MDDKQTVISNLAAAANELHASQAGHPNVISAIEGAMAFLNEDTAPPVSAYVPDYPIPPDPLSAPPAPSVADPTPLPDA